MIVFVYEDVCATAAGGDGQSPPAASLLREGRAMLDAVTADFQAVSGVQVETATSSADFVKLARIADYTLVIAPETGGRLEQLASEVIRAGGRLLGPSPDAIRLTSDKLALARHWEANGVQSPRTWPLGEEPGDGPIIVKPRDGAGSQEMELFRSGGRSAARTTPRCASASAGFIAQQYVPGFAASIAYLIGPSTSVALIPCAQRLSVDDRFQYQGGYLPIATDLAQRAVSIASAAVQRVPGLLGYVGVDVVLGDDGRDWTIEINPRLTTSYVGLRALAKFNIAEAMLAIVRGESIPDLPWKTGTIEFTPDGRTSLLVA